MDNVSCKFCTFKSTAAQKLNDAELDEMNANCAKVLFKAGDTIITQDTLSTSMVYLRTGLVKVHIKGPVREKIMRIVKAPAYLCLPSVFGDKVYHFSATALEDTSVCFIDNITFKNLINQNGDFAYEIIREMGKGELLSFHSLINNSQKQNAGRVADTIFFFARDIYKSNSFTLPVSRQELGDLLGITRESASRILTDFHNEKILHIEGKKITIVNEDLLKQISDKG